MCELIKNDSGLFLRSAISSDVRHIHLRIHEADEKVQAEPPPPPPPPHPGIIRPAGTTLAATGSPSSPAHSITSQESSEAQLHYGGEEE